MKLLSPLQYAKGDNPRLGNLRIERVLVPVDFSVCTLATLQYAGAVAQRFHAVVSLLHVIPANISRNEGGPASATLIRTMSEAAQKELHQLAEIVWAGEIIATIIIREGRPDDVILQEARNLNPDLIIMGKRGHSWSSRLFRHNTVKHVLQQAPCPVIVLRAGVKASDAEFNFNRPCVDRKVKPSRDAGCVPFTAARYD